MYIYIFTKTMHQSIMQGQEKERNKLINLLHLILARLKI